MIRTFRGIRLVPWLLAGAMACSSAAARPPQPAPAPSAPPADQPPVRIPVSAAPVVRRRRDRERLGGRVCGRGLALFPRGGRHPGPALRGEGERHGRRAEQGLRQGLACLVGALGVHGHARGQSTGAHRGLHPERDGHGAPRVLAHQGHAQLHHDQPHRRPGGDDGPRPGLDRPRRWGGRPRPAPRSRRRASTSGNGR